MASIEPGLTPDADVNAKIDACAADNPCEGAWQASYAYAADRAYDLAVYQALQMIAFGVMQYASADRTADMQYEIADRQMIIAEEEYQRYKDVYIECEEALNAEVCALVRPTVEYGQVRASALRAVTKQFSLQRAKMLRVRKRFCAVDTLHDVCDLNKTEALVSIAAMQAATKAAEERRDFLENERWTKKTWGVSLGRQVMTGQSDIYAGAMGLASDAVGARGNAMRGLLGTLSGAVGGILNASYGPQINAPTVFGINQSSAFDTRWGRFNGGKIS